ncbi:2-keto-4-pentenoate hydratase [Devosia sp. YR412]|uniref:2-keto-4-pentenoate hydratase n=1 Tax=Devosia sp. YR412 TaxID=1881030 RepID=UPI0008C72D28|nr:fumarylacetoacetate hydrolase family protein [Devosia sp. YR412]SEQ48292.1 2-keto-4-pentenoate hydratase [Devosia sp. YR412]
MTHPLTSLLLSHRASGTPIVDLPAEAVPQSVEEAYQVQAETVAGLGPVGAWKLAPMPETGVPFAAPILAKDVVASGATLALADFSDLAIEVEVALIIGQDLPARAEGYTPADVKSVIGSVSVALELLATRFVDRSTQPRLAMIADLQNNGGVVLGAPVPADNLPEFGQQAMVLRFDGVEAAQTVGNATTENMLAALAWLAGHAASIGLPLKAGDVVITGARLGPVALGGNQVEAEAAGLGKVSVTFG